MGYNNSDGAPGMLKRQTHTKTAVCAQKLGVIAGSVNDPGKTEMTHEHQVRNLRTKSKGVCNLPT